MGKFKKGMVALALTAVTLMVSCENTSILDLEVAQGKVANKDWVFGGGHATYGISEISIVIMDSTVAYPDNCSVLKSSKPYVTFTIPEAVGTFYLPLSDFDKNLKFHLGSPSTTNYSATSGYIQVTAITDYGVEGLIIASLDEENDIAGAFYVDPCN